MIWLQGCLPVCDFCSLSVQYRIWTPSMENQQHNFHLSEMKVFFPLLYIYFIWKIWSSSSYLVTGSTDTSPGASTILLVITALHCSLNREKKPLNLPILFNVYLAALDLEMLCPQSSQLSYLKYGQRLIKDEKGQDFGFMFCLKDLDIPVCTELCKIILGFLSGLIYDHMCQM